MAVPQKAEFQSALHIVVRLLWDYDADIVSQTESLPAPTVMDNSCPVILSISGISSTRHSTSLVLCHVARSSPKHLLENTNALAKTQPTVAILAQSISGTTPKRSTPTASSLHELSPPRRLTLNLRLLYISFNKQHRRSLLSQPLIYTSIPLISSILYIAIVLTSITPAHCFSTDGFSAHHHCPHKAVMTTTWSVAYWCSTKACQFRLLRGSIPGLYIAS